MLDPAQLTAWVTAGKSGIELIRAAAGLLPKGERKDEIEYKLGEAENALAASNAKLAHDLGYKMCQCTFPPQIMLWENASESHACPNPKCGRRIVRAKPVRVSESSWAKARHRF